jgi:hypothetical protein
MKKHIYIIALLLIGCSVTAQRRIVVYADTGIVLNNELPDGVGVFYNTDVYTAKVYTAETEEEAGEYAEAIHSVRPVDVTGLKAFADRMNIPYPASVTISELQDIVDVWITTSNYPAMWEAGQQLTAGEVIEFDGTWYEVIQSHTTQSDWTPSACPALFVVTAEPGECPDWVQPTGAHDAYNIGDCVIFNGQQYESVINANVWSPSVYPTGWRLIQ